MRNIQMVDLKSQYYKIENEINEAIKQVLIDGQYINGKIVQDFTEQLRQYTSSKFIVPCANGTDALQIAFMALDLQPGDEVIVPVHTYVATAEAIALLRLTPVFIDVTPDTFVLDVDQLEEKITKKTKAIVPVHLYGQCANMEQINKIAEKHNLFVIEDNAQAIGSIYTFSDGTVKQSGTMSHIGTTSFFPSKNLGGYGDGGAMYVQDEVLYNKIRMIVNHGQGERYYHDIIGCNSRLDSIQAAILSIKLKHLDEYIAARQKTAAEYDKAFANHSLIKTPIRTNYSTHVFHQYTVLIDESIGRDIFKQKLEELGVPSMIYYPVPLHLQKAYFNPAFPEGSFPVSEKLSKTVISLPIHTEMDSKTQSFIIESVLSLL